MGEEMGADVVKPSVTAEPRRNENTELWALLNYSKMRLETGSTPSLGKKASSLRGDDMSVSSKLSKTSKASRRSMGSGSRKSILVVGGPGSASPSNSTDVGAEITPDVPCPDVTNDGNVSVDG